MAGLATNKSLIEPGSCTSVPVLAEMFSVSDGWTAPDWAAAGAAKEYAACGSRAYIPFFNVGGEQAVNALSWRGSGRAIPARDNRARIPCRSPRD